MAAIMRDDSCEKERHSTNMHEGQDNRTNIPKRDTDGSEQSSGSTL